jgi:hypothetical protein
VISTISFTTSYSDSRPAPANFVALASASLILVINPWLSIAIHAYPWLGCRCMTEEGGCYVVGSMSYMFQETPVKLAV